MDPKNFRKMIRRALLEEVEKRSSTGDQDIYERVPEVTHGEEYKDVVPHKPDGKTKIEILDTITKAVKDIDSSSTVVWDDHDDISISALDLFRVRISPRWENSYNIEAMVHNEDRIYITNQTIEQVVAFLKVNLKNAKSNTQKAYDKSKSNADMKNDKTKAPDKGLNQKDKPKIYPLTNEPLKTARTKERTQTEIMTKEKDDYPERPMRPVTSVKHQVDHKITNPKTMMKEKTKFPEKKPNTQLSVKIEKQDTSKWKA